MNNYFIVVLFVLAGVIWGCGADKTNEQIVTEMDSILQITQKEKIALPDEKLQDIVKHIPSPIEMAAIIRASGAKYSDKLLNNTGNVSNYTP